MPLTLDETKLLIGLLGLQIADDVLGGKAKAEQFKTRQEKLASDATNKPADWRWKQNFDDTLKRAREAADKAQFDSALKLLDEAETILQQPDVAPPASAIPTKVPSPAEGPRQDDSPELIAQMDARLVAAAQQAFTDYLQMKPGFTAVGSVEVQVQRLQALNEKWQRRVGDRGSKANRKKMQLLQKKVALEIDAYETLKKHAATMDDLMQRIEQATEAGNKAQLVAELQGLMDTFPA